MHANLLLFFVSALPAQDVGTESAASDQARSTAVALNYCRASFHRIRRYPTKAVLIEEQEKILNNLDLNGLADQQVVELYTEVLDEIGQIQIADHERVVLRDKYKQQIRRQISANTFVAVTQLASMQFGSAVRTGANSWWDYRNATSQRELENWRIEKQQMGAVVDKSSKFLDTFWKLAKEKNIPDRWLVRNNDLDQLEQALQEPDLEVRLRILKRMEKFMECYPPYWYYVARTEQMRGQLFAAANTYTRLAELGAGHFRQDEMLAAGVANLAAIQEGLNQPGAPRTALAALRYSTQVWEANLVSARVLANHSQYAEAEDAILRNLDVDLERQQSLASLVSLYYVSNDGAKMVKYLGDPQVVADLPVPLLLVCAAKLGQPNVPAVAVSHITQSLYGYPRIHFGRDDLVLMTSHGWHLNRDSKMALSLGQRQFGQPTVEPSEDGTSVQFSGILDLGNPLSASSPTNMAAHLDLSYPGAPPIRVVMQFRPQADSHLPSIGADTNYAAESGRRRAISSAPVLQVVAAQVGDTYLPLAKNAPVYRTLPTTNDFGTRTATEQLPSRSRPVSISVPSIVTDDDIGTARLTDREIPLEAPAPMRFDSSGN